jgi:hypothetical protein
VPSPARIVSSPPHPPHSVCRVNALHPFNLSVGVCFRHTNTTALDVRTQRSPVPASRPNIQPRGNRQDACVALACSARVLSLLCAYVLPTQDRPQQLADSSATFLQQSGLRGAAIHKSQYAARGGLVTSLPGDRGRCKRCMGAEIEAKRSSFVPATFLPTNRKIHMSPHASPFDRGR